MPGDDTPDEGSPDRDTLAAEYVLGLLDPEDRRAMDRAIGHDPALAHAVGAWGVRLEPLALLAQPVPPSDMLWGRIARDLPDRAGSGPRAARPTQGSVIGRGVALGGYALAAGLAVALLLSRHRLDVHVAWDQPAMRGPAVPSAGAVATPSSLPSKVGSPITLPPSPVVRPPAAPAPQAVAQPPFARGAAVALLTAAGGDRPAMKAFFVQGGTVRLVPVQRVDVPPDRQLGFWVWPRGTALPIPLGRVDPEGGTLRFPYREADGTPVMVTLEPRQQPVTQAQGPTLFTGQLIEVE